MLKQIDKIKYKNKTIDTGLIIGQRKYRWTLKQQYQPCWAKNGVYISELSPHKKSFDVYIPYRELKRCKGETVRIGDTDTIKTIKILDVNENFVNFEEVKSEKYVKWKRRKTDKVKTGISEDFPI